MLYFDEYLHRNTIHEGGCGSFLLPQLISLSLGIPIHLGSSSLGIPIPFDFCSFGIPFTWDPQSFGIPIHLGFCSFVILLIWNPIRLALPFIQYPINLGSPFTWGPRAFGIPFIEDPHLSGISLIPFLLPFQASYARASPHPHHTFP